MPLRGSGTGEYGDSPYSLFPNTCKQVLTSANEPFWIKSQLLRTADKVLYCRQMQDDLVIFVKCRSTAEKRAFVSAARNRGISVNRFAIESIGCRACRPR